jgi:hypothetical protein
MVAAATALLLTGPAIIGPADAALPPAGSPSKGAQPPQGANPYLSLLPDPPSADYANWKAKVAAAGKKRAFQKLQRDQAARRAGLAPEPLVVDEQEPSDLRGSNDTPGSAESIPSFGSAPGQRPAARILGTLAPSAFPVPVARAPEDNGSIPLAGDTGLTGSGTRTSIRTRIGNGPHGSEGDASGDFDFYTLTDGHAGQTFDVDIDTKTGSELDSFVVLWDPSGNALAFNDDDQGLDSHLTFTLPHDGDYFVSVGGFPSAAPSDPFDSGSGFGVGSEGKYKINFGLDAGDSDFYRVNLRAGDVLGGSVAGVATHIAAHGPSEALLIDSAQDASGIYPPSSPLPGGGNAVFGYVADVTGPHTVAVYGGLGDYDITLEVYRPGPEAIGSAIPTIFLDFDGARVNTAMFGGPGVRDLSPLRSFLGRWGLNASDESALISRIVQIVKENLKKDFGTGGVSVRILNSRDHPDPFGQPNVSRVVVGGTIQESGVPTIGVAQSIDPGNAELEETALVLLDVLSDPPGVYEDPNPSLNAYLTPESNRVRFVGTAIGNVVAHEAGHYVGSFHVDQFNDVLNLMDQGGNFPLLYGVGPDGIGGTADDVDVDFGEDTYNPDEGFLGTEDTAANTKWGLSPVR